MDRFGNPCTVKKTTLAERRRMKGCRNGVLIEECLFKRLNCIRAEGGGALYFFQKNSHITVNQCCFSDCSTPCGYGGALLCFSSKNVITRNSFLRCYSGGSKMQACNLEVDGGEPNLFEECYVCQCCRLKEGDDVSVQLTSGDILSQYSNFTQNSLSGYGVLGLALTDNGNVRHCTFDQNNADLVMFCQYEYKVFMQNCLFYKNKANGAKEGLFYGYFTTLDMGDSYVLKNQGYKRLIYSNSYKVVSDCSRVYAYGNDFPMGEDMKTKNKDTDVIISNYPALECV